MAVGSYVITKDHMIGIIAAIISTKVCVYLSNNARKVYDMEDLTLL